MNTSSPLQNELTQKLQLLDEASLRRQQKIVTPLQNGRCLVNGRELYDFSSNDYLGFSQHPEVIAAAVEAIQEYGVGSRASMLVSGWSPVHQLLKERISEFEQTESAILFSSGYAACQGAISTIIDANDIVFCERSNHACLVDGCRLSNAKFRVYRNYRLEILERELKKSASFPHRWIVTETVFGMDATIAPMDELIELAEKYDAYLICDEAHASGIYGPKGVGIISEFYDDVTIPLEIVDRRVPLRIGTLSKAFGSQGGFVAGSSEIIELLWNRAKTAMFSTALSIPACAAAAKAIQLLLDDKEQLPLGLRCNAGVFRSLLYEDKFEVFGESNNPIIPIIIEDPELVIKMAHHLEQAGFLVAAIRPPTVPRGTSRLRISLNANFSMDDLKLLRKAMNNARSGKNIK